MALLAMVVRSSFFLSYRSWFGLIKSSSNLKNVPSIHNILILDRSPNLGPLMSRWEINNFKSRWYKSVKILEVLKLLFQQFLNLSSSQQDMSGPRLWDLSNNRILGSTKVSSSLTSSFALQRKVCHGHDESGQRRYESRFGSTRRDEWSCWKGRSCPRRRRGWRECQQLPAIWRWARALITAQSGLFVAFPFEIFSWHGGNLDMEKWRSTGVATVGPKPQGAKFDRSSLPASLARFFEEAVLTVDDDAFLEYLAMLARHLETISTMNLNNSVRRYFYLLYSNSSLSFVPVPTIDYRCVDGRFTFSARCVMISDGRSFQQ